MVRMQQEVSQTRDQLAAAYLEQLQTLAVEIDVAMGAIATNALANFQESVAKQEMLCASLAMMASVVGKGFLSDLSLPPLLDVTIEAKIRAMTDAIRTLNLQYAALLKHSGRSIALLASLCRSHTGNAQEAPGTKSKQQTWSCEM
jgi:hypothetical protein